MYKLEYSPIASVYTLANSHVLDMHVYHLTPIINFGKSPGMVN